MGFYSYQNKYGWNGVSYHSNTVIARVHKSLFRGHESLLSAQIGSVSVYTVDLVDYSTDCFFLMTGKRLGV